MPIPLGKRRVRLEVLPERKTVFPKAATCFVETIIAVVTPPQSLRMELPAVKKLARTPLPPKAIRLWSAISAVRLERLS